MQRSSQHETDSTRDGAQQQQQPSGASAPVANNSSSNPILAALQQTIASNLQVSYILENASSNNSSSNNNANGSNIVAPVQPQTILNSALLPYALQAPSQSSLPLGRGAGGGGGLVTNPVVNNTAATNQTNSILASLGLPPQQAASTTSSSNTANIYNNLFAQTMSSGNNTSLLLNQSSSSNNNNNPQQLPALSSFGHTNNSQGATGAGVAQQVQLASLRQNLLNDLGRRQANDLQSFIATQRSSITSNPTSTTANLFEAPRQQIMTTTEEEAQQPSTLMLLQQQYNNNNNNVATAASPPPMMATTTSTREFSFEELVSHSSLTNINLRGLVSDSFFVAIAQMRPCKLEEDDRVGKYKHRELGFVGICCRHCAGQPGFGRYFPGSFDSFLNGKNSDGIVRHVLECRRCPAEIREIIIELEQHEKARPTRPKYGSRKSFFAYIWEELRSPKMAELIDAEEKILLNSSQEQDATSSSADKAMVSETNGNGGEASSSSATIDNPVLDNGEISWEALTATSQVVSIEDRDLVPDVLVAALAQMQPTALTSHDQIGRCKSHRVGFMGMCCRWCCGKSGKPGFGRYFPSSIRSLAQVDSVNHIVKHVALKCTKCPPTIRKIVLQLQLDESGSARRLRYGARKMFFKRVWARLHGDDKTEKPIHGRMSHEVTSSSANDTGEGDGDNDIEEELVPIETDWNRLLSGSSLVTEEDEGLVTPSQFAAMAQMKACRLTPSDQTGWYKKRALNFGGFCCRHCGGGGRASFGRYFPNTHRSFAQTISSNTIVIHITAYCKKCPDDIRTAVVELYERDKKLAARKKVPGISNYGSRKTFYDRVWTRIHDSRVNTLLKKSESSSNRQPSYGAAAIAFAAANAAAAGGSEIMAATNPSANATGTAPYKRPPCDNHSADTANNKRQKTGEIIVLDNGGIGTTSVEDFIVRRTI